VTVAARRELPELSDGDLKLLQERGETFRDRLVGGIVLGPEPLPEFPQPWPSGQDVTTFGLARLTLPALAPPTKFSAARGMPLDA
jgi:hypothetical protein